MIFRKLAFAMALMATMLSSTEMSAKQKIVPKIYMYGFSASFNDSIVYFTDMVEVDSAWIDSKSNFLLGRENYSLQLKNYLADKVKSPNRTCIVVYNKKKSNLAKDYAKLKKMYAGKGKKTYDIKIIASNDFTFKPIDMRLEEGEPVQPEGSQSNKPKSVTTK